MPENQVDQKALRRELVILIGVLIAFAAFLYGVHLVINHLYNEALEPIAAVTGETTQEVDGKRARELTGSVVAIGENKDFVRLSVSGEGIYSVGIPDTGSEFITQVETYPLALFTIVVTEERATEMYDFMMRDYKKEVEDMTIEDRIKRTEQSGISTN